VVRHISGHQVIAVIEIVSAPNKDRKAHVRELAEKVVRGLEAGIHVLLLDLLPAGPHDPQGLHGAIWHYFDTTPQESLPHGPLTLVAYAWEGEAPRAWLEPRAVGETLIDMPLFLTAEHYVNVPLQPTYDRAYRGMPKISRTLLEEGPAATSAGGPG
jgi:hypothetical protein